MQVIETYLDETTVSVITAKVIEKALDMKPKEIGDAEQKRAVKCLRALGWTTNNKPGTKAASVVSAGKRRYY